MKNFYDFYKLLSESFQQKDEFLSFILKAVENKKEEKGDNSYMNAIMAVDREIREPLTNFTVNDYGDLIRFLYFVYGDMTIGEDNSPFRRQVKCIGYFFSLAVTDDVLQKSDVIRVIAINNCENPNMPEFIKDFKEFASSHGYNFGSNWTNLYQSLASRSEIIFDGSDGYSNFHITYGDTLVWDLVHGTFDKFDLSGWDEEYGATGKIIIDYPKNKITVVMDTYTASEMSVTYKKYKF